MQWLWLMTALICMSLHVHSTPCSWVQVENSWTTGFTAVLNIQMEETLDQWSVGIEFTHSVLKFEAWKGTVTKVSDNIYSIRSNCYNNMVYSCQCFQLPYLVRHKPNWTGNTTVRFNRDLTPSCCSDPCIEDTTTPSGLSVLEAIVAARATVNAIVDGLENLENNRSRREANNFIDDENNLLERLTNLTIYLQNNCSSKTGKCESQKIEEFRSELESSFDNINNTGKISSGFLVTFQNARRRFDQVAAAAEEAHGKSITTTTTTTSKTTTTSTTKDPPECPLKSELMLGLRKRRSVLEETMHQRIIQDTASTTRKTTTMTRTIPTTTGISILEALNHINMTINNFNNDILSSFHKNRYRSLANNLSKDENKTLEIMNNLVSYLENCLSKTENCVGSDILTFRIDLLETFSLIIYSGSASTEFFDKFEIILKRYYEVAGQLLPPPPPTPIPQPGVSCGGHLETECSKCPQGNGANWCHGDCDWIDKTCVPGVKQCIPDAHVHNQCKCGEEICPIEGRCMSGGFCDKPTVCPEREVNGSSRRRRDTLLQDKVEFRLVHINETGIMATVRDVEENLDKAKKLLLSCDIAKLDDGHIEGVHYGGNVSNENCTRCLYKIIKNNGAMFCTTDKHVYKRCQCGVEICEVGNSCTEGLCNRKTDCPIGYSRKNKTLQIMSEQSTRSKSLVQIRDINSLNGFKYFGLSYWSKYRHCIIQDDFQLVAINSTGPLATVEEMQIKENLENVKKLLEKCDIAKLDGGFIEGSGYGGNLTERECLECNYKIIRKIKPPPKEYNNNVSDKCCFILRNTDENRTYVLTNHSLLLSFPRENCSAGCIYTPYDELDCIDAPRTCLEKIGNYTCCSQNTGALCNKYGEETKNNVYQNETCSSVCSEIADCSSDSSNEWCTNSNLSGEDSYQTAGGNDASMTTKSTMIEDSSIHVPEHCELIPYTIPVKQTAVVYPKALPATPFTKPCDNRNLGLAKFKRSLASCGFWNFWTFTCMHAFDYTVHFDKKDWYRMTETCYNFNNDCCSSMQYYCKTKGESYVCPSQIGGEKKC